MAFHEKYLFAKNIKVLDKIAPASCEQKTSASDSGLTLPGRPVQKICCDGTAVYCPDTSTLYTKYLVSPCHGKGLTNSR